MLALLRACERETESECERERESEREKKMKALHEINVVASDVYLLVVVVVVVEVIVPGQKVNTDTHANSTNSTNSLLFELKDSNFERFKLKASRSRQKTR